MRNLLSSKRFTNTLYFVLACICAILLSILPACSGSSPRGTKAPRSSVLSSAMEAPTELVTATPEAFLPELPVGMMQAMEPKDNALTRELSGTGISQVTVETTNFTFEGLVSGPATGEPVVLLHGFPSTSYQWRSQLQALADAGFRAFAPNQRGYSPDARPDGVNAYTYDLLAQDVFDIADALGWEKFHLVGHDWGAFVSWAAAGIAPSRILTLTPISVPHPEAFAEALADPDGEQAQMSSYMEFFRSSGSEHTFLDNEAELLKSIYSSAGLSEKEMEPYLEVLGTPDALGAALNWYRANSFLGNSTDAIVARRTEIPDTIVPTMFIWSDQDTALGRQGAELTENFVSSDYRFEVIEEVNHWVTEVAAEQVNHLLLEHLANS